MCTVHLYHDKKTLQNLLIVLLIVVLMQYTIYLCCISVVVQLSFMNRKPKVRHKHLNSVFLQLSFKIHLVQRSERACLNGCEASGSLFRGIKK